MNETLLRALVETIVFVGTSPEETMRQDAAVRCLEDVAALLQKLSYPERQELARFVGRLADHEANAGGDPDRVRFLQNMLSDLGLTEP